MPRRKGDAKASYKLAQIMDPGFELPTDRSELLKVYRTAAKAADQRLVRLERLTQQENFKIADKWAYARAMRDIEAWSGDEATRFNTKPPSSNQGIVHKIEDIRTFLRAPSSTKTGIVKIYEKRAKTLKDDYNLNVSWSEAETFFDSDEWRTLGGDPGNKNGKYESKTLAKAIGKFKRHYTKDQIKKAIKQANKKDIKVPDNKKIIIEDKDAVKDLQVEHIMKSLIEDKKDSAMLMRLLFK